MTLELAQALYLIGRLPGETLPELASTLLERGQDTPAVRELAGMQRPTVRDAGSVFERLLAELGRSPINIERAALVIANDLAHKVLGGEMLPSQAAARGSFLCHDAGYHPVLTRFLALDDDYECYPDQRDSIDDEVRRYCQELVGANNRSAV